MPPIIFTPSRCHVNTGAIARNFAKLGDAARLMPVIKSDAYGHGLLQVAASLRGARRFAVGLASEGIALRESGFDQDIVLLMGCLTPDDWRAAHKYRLMPIAGSASDISMASAALAGARVDIAIKCDTGMGRLGFAATENVMDAAHAGELLRQAPCLSPRMVISHLACADMPEQNDLTQAQARRFNAFHSHMAALFPGIARSLCNSAATLTHIPDDICRPGLAIYGGNPFGPKPCGLEWAMSVCTPILHIHELAPGQSVSYGAIFTARRPMRIAVVATGYAAGFARALSGRAQMLVRGRRIRQIGRICMSMAMLDITGMPEARQGDLAWIMGGQAAEGQEPVNAWELASLLGTIPYELLCLLGGMNPRVYD